MGDEQLLTILKWFGAADAILLLVAAALFLVWLSVEYICRVTGIAKALVQWRFEKWRAQRRIVTNKADSP